MNDCIGLDGKAARREGTCRLSALGSRVQPTNAGVASARVMTGVQLTRTPVLSAPVELTDRIEHRAEGG
jgi:hypothetical protein